MLKNFLSTSVQNTQDIALELIPEILHTRIILFKGDLGSGKSLMCRTIIQKLCNNSNLVISSPTFGILNTYQSKTHDLIYHFDLYRLKSLAEIQEIGLSDLLIHKKNICLIEWPEIIEPITDNNLLIIEIIHINEDDSRQIIIKNYNN